MNDVVTTCGECLAACGIRVTPDRRVLGDGDNPVTRGYVCANGRVAVELLDHPGRLRVPLVRGAPASWSAALDDAAGAIRKAIADHGPDSVALYFGAGDPAGSMAFLAASGFLQAIGSRRHFNVIGLEATHRYVVAEAMTGDSFAVVRPDFDHASGALVVGTNPLVTNDEGGIVAAFDALRRRRGRLVVLDPRKSELARAADAHLQLRPGTDLEALLAIVHVLFRENHVVDDLGERFDGVDALRRLAATVPPERAAAVCDVPAAHLEHAARLLAWSRPTTTMSRLGCSMSRAGTVQEWLAHAIVALLGGMGARGGLVLNPGFLDFRAMMRRAPVDPSSIIGVLPPSELADGILDGQLKVLVVVAADPVESLPNTTKVVRALRQLESLVVLDVVPTATTALARVVLPCAHHLEKSDVALLLPDRVPLRHAKGSRPVARPPGESKSEVAIFAELADRLGKPLFGARAIDAAIRIGAGLAREERPQSPESAMRVLLPLLSRLTLTWRRAARGWLGGQEGELDPSALRAVVARPGGRIDLAPPRFVEAAKSLLVRAPAVDGETPMPMLSTCVRVREGVNGKLRLVGRAIDRAWLHLNPEDARALGCGEGDRVRVESRVGALEAEVTLDETLRRGAAAIPFGTPGLNVLTDDDDRDALSGIPAMAHVVCRITRIAKDGGAS